MEIIQSPTVPRLQQNLWLDSTNNTLNAPTKDGWQSITSGASGGGSKSKTIVFEDGKVVKLDVNALLYKALKPLLLDAKEEDIVDSKLAICTTESLPFFTIKGGTVYYPCNYSTVSGNPGGTLVTYADRKDNEIKIDGGNLCQTYSPTSDVFTDAQLDVLYKLQVQATELDASPETVDPNFNATLNNGKYYGDCYDFMVVSTDLNTDNEAYIYNFILEEVEGYDNCVKILDVVKSEDTVPVDGVLQLSLEDVKKLIGIHGNTGGSPVVPIIPEG